jgi:hypothetical protein
LEYWSGGFGPATLQRLLSGYFVAIMSSRDSPLKKLNAEELFNLSYLKQLGKSG